MIAYATSPGAYILGDLLPMKINSIFMLLGEMPELSVYIRREVPLVTLQKEEEISSYNSGCFAPTAWY